MRPLAPKEKLQWSHSSSSYLAAICVITGFVNFWRFPELLAKYGALHFMSAYLVCITLLALPVILVQWRVGRSMRGNSVTALLKLAQVGPGFSIWKLAGGMMLISCGLTAGIYTLTSGLTFAFTFKAALGQLSQVDPVGLVMQVDSLLSDSSSWMIWFSLILSMAFVVAARGLVGGLERVLPYLVNILFILLLVLVAVALSQPESGTAIELIFRETQYSWQPGLWIDAVIQAFFSLGLGSGIHFLLGAYCTAGLKDSRLLALMLSADFGISMLAAFAVYPILVSADLPLTGGFTLVFQSIPLAFQAIPSGSFFLALYYIMLTLVAFTSLLVLLEPVVHLLQVSFYMRRRLAVMLVFTFLWVLALLLVQSFHLADSGDDVLPWFLLIQFGVSAFLLPLSLLLVLILLVYVLPTGRLAMALELQEQGPRYILLRRWLRYLCVPLVFAVQIFVLVALLQHFCLVGGVFAGSICAM